MENSNRVLKFRAWDKEKNKMIEFSIWGTDGGYCLSGEEYLPSMPIMQFINLKDCKGKEIFEGDVVRDWHDNLGEVIFLDGQFKTTKGTWVKYPVDFKKCEVIGNVYENEDLLINH